MKLIPRVVPGRGQSHCPVAPGRKSQRITALAVCASGEIRAVARRALTHKVRFGAVILFSAISLACAASGPLTSLQAIHRLTNAEAAKGLPVAFQATVTYFSMWRENLFVQDGQTGIYVLDPLATRLVPGDRIFLKGVTAAGFRPYIFANEITLLGRVPLPKPAPVTFEDLIRSRYDSALVTVRGVVRTANPDAQWAPGSSGGVLNILTDGGYVETIVNTGRPHEVENLLDAEVAATGVAGGSFDGKKQQTGAALHVSTLSDIRVLKPAAHSPWLLPATPMNQILGTYHVKNLTGRVRVSGSITFYEPGSALVLENGAKSLWIVTQSFAPVHIGDQADAIGFPSANDSFLELATSEVRDLGVAAPVTPLPVTKQQLTSGEHFFDLVSIEGKVAMTAREAAQDDYVLESDGYAFSAIFRHPAMEQNALPPMKQIPVGSRIRVTGICLPNNSFLSRHNGHFNILMRSEDDIAMVAQPSWLTVDHVVKLAGLLLIIVLGLGMRGWFLERRTRRQIGSLAYVEQRRGRILEDINHSKALAEIIEQITDLVSFRLNGAPCWCQITDGATLGNRPPQLRSSLRTVEHPIAARSGPAHGVIFAALDARTKPSNVEAAVLAMAGELATLAIETSRLYSDLVHRSEFDILTEVQNRFAMDKALRAEIQAARQNAGVFGLIYIDLNEFKQVNDVFGHHAGDQYLQELARRMKGQLRPGDTLARLGGDEFAVLVSNAHNRANVEEVAARLSSCFDEPFKGEGYELRGSASIGIALYPEDADSTDGLLHAADTAMYEAKHTRMGTRQMAER